MKKAVVLLVVFLGLIINIDAQTKSSSRLADALPTPTPVPLTVKSDDDEGLKVGVSMERYVNNYEVNADGSAVQTLEIMQKLTSPVLAERINIQKTEFNADLQDIEVLEAYKILANGQKIAVPRSKIQITLTPQAEAAPAFSSVKSLEIDFGGLKVGDAIYFKNRIIEKKQYFEGKFSAFLIFPFFFDYKFAEVNLSAPVNYPIYFEAVELAGGKLRDEGGRSHWQWRRTPSIGKNVQIGRTDIVDSSPRLAITSFKDYAELGATYWKEAKEKSRVTPEIQKLADEITKDLTTPQDRASAIYEWVNKNIRYLSVILDRGGWIPHDANSIVNNGYGDCKDYTTLLQSLLLAKGIESRHILVKTDEVFWFPKVAIPEMFDHVILYIPTLDVFADATAANTRLGLISALLRGRRGVSVGEKSAPIMIPEEKAEDNQFISDTAVSFSESGNIDSVSNNTYVGQPEMLFRPLFADSRLLNENSDLFIEAILRTYGVKGTGKILKVSDSHKVGEPFNVELSVKIDDYTTFMPKGVLSLPVMLNLYNVLGLEKLVLTEKKENPTAVGATIFRETFNLKFPDGMTIESVPTGTKIDNPIGSFLAVYRIEGNSIKINREFVIKKTVIQPNEYPLFRDLVRKVVAEYKAQFFYTADPNFLRQKLIGKRTQGAQKSLIDIYKPLTSSQEAQLEADLEKNPQDVDIRKRLLQHYRNAKLTPDQVKKQTEHQLWFVKNHPETDVSDVFGYSISFPESARADYELFKAEWLKQIEEKKRNYQVWLNAVEFFSEDDPSLSEKLLLDAEKNFPGKFDFTLKLFSIYEEKAAGKTLKEEERKNYLLRSAEKGEAALTMLKKERSETRDMERAALLPKLGEIALKLGKPERANALARELILEFGDDATEAEYDEAVHKGNIIFGKIALLEGNLAKAREYLIIAIKAPLRKKYGTFSYPNLELAAGLLEKGEKETVLEYLNLCEQLSSTDKTSLKKWQAEIRQGKTPDFKWF